MEINDRLLDVLRYELRKEGLYAAHPVPDEALVVSKRGIPVAYIQEDGFIVYPTLDNREDAKPVPAIVSRVWEVERAYQEASTLSIDSVSEYRKLLDYNGVVLAARYDGGGEYTFVSWQYTYDKTAVSLGHYFHKNAYASAKEDFLFRSGLADRSTSFQPDELSVIRENLLYRGIHDTELQKENREDIDRLLHRIDAMLAPIDKLLLETEAELDRER